TLGPSFYPLAPGILASEFLRTIRRKNSRAAGAERQPITRGPVRHDARLGPTKPISSRSLRRAAALPAATGRGLFYGIFGNKVSGSICGRVLAHAPHRVTKGHFGAPSFSNH